MGLSRQEIAIWERVGYRYDEGSRCKDCGESFYAPHLPTCIWSDEVARLNERVTCGDCLRPSCPGCM